MLSPEQLEARRAELEAELGEPITVDGLTATWSIFQRRKGHRHSTDDLLTAWYAIEKSREIVAEKKSAGENVSCLDLGTGIGGVGLLVLAGIDPGAGTHLTCIEAQEISFRFLQENIRANGVTDRVTAIHGDLRELQIPRSDRTFQLITGSPPYFDPSAGIIPSDPQKAHARFELRGDVHDYVRAAKRHMNMSLGSGLGLGSDASLFVFCFPWQQKARALDALRLEGINVVSRDVIPREGLSPLFSLFVCRASDASEEREACEEPFVVRLRDGSHTQAMHDVRAAFGWKRM